MVFTMEYYTAMKMDHSYTQQHGGGKKQDPKDIYIYIYMISLYIKIKIC